MVRNALAILTGLVLAAGLQAALGYQREGRLVVDNVPGIWHAPVNLGPSHQMNWYWQPSYWDRSKVVAAADRWRIFTLPDFEFHDAGDLASDPRQALCAGTFSNGGGWNSANGKNTVGVLFDSVSPDAAVTCVDFDSITGQIIETDTTINGADGVWGLSPDYVPKWVLTRHFGLALGLASECLAESVMWDGADCYGPQICNPQLDSNCIYPQTDDLNGVSSIYSDSDGDGCVDLEELGRYTRLGGARDANDEWDFYDVDGTRKVDSLDIGGVRGKFGLRAGWAGYSTTYDRSESGESWAPNGPDGKINAIDIALVRGVFLHTCRGGP